MFGDMMMGWVLVEILARIPLIQDLAHVRYRASFGFWGCLGVSGDVGRGRSCLVGSVGEVWVFFDISQVFPCFGP